jgi:hypothetical protein
VLRDSEREAVADLLNYLENVRPVFVFTALFTSYLGDEFVQLIATLLESRDGLLFRRAIGGAFNARIQPEH